MWPILVVFWQSSYCRLLCFICQDLNKLQQQQQQKEFSFGHVLCSYILFIIYSTLKSFCLCQHSNVLLYLNAMDLYFSTLLFHQRKYQPSGWMFNNTGLVSKLQLIVGNLSFNKWLADEFTIFGETLEILLHTLWFWVLNKNESLTVLKSHFYAHLTCVNN